MELILDLDDHLASFSALTLLVGCDQIVVLLVAVKRLTVKTDVTYFPFDGTLNFTLLLLCFVFIVCLLL